MMRPALNALLACAVLAGAIHLASAAQAGAAPRACCREVCLKHCLVSGETSGTCGSVCGTCVSCKAIDGEVASSGRAGAGRGDGGLHELNTEEAT